MASQEYWKNRETEAKKHNIQEEAEYNRKIRIRRNLQSIWRRDSVSVLIMRRGS